MGKCINNQQQKGFTLIELLLYAVIVGGLLIATTGFYIMAANARIKNQSIAEVNQQGIAAVNLITQTIRNGTGVSSPAAGGSASSVTVPVVTAALSPTVFSLNGSTLQITEGSGSAVPLTNSKVRVTNFTVKNLARSGSITNVQVSLTLSRASDSPRDEYSYQNTFTASAEVQW